MTTVVLSPHTDDAVFSIGDHLCSLSDAVVVAPMAGIPADPAGKAKHETLRAEHAIAMSIIGATYINGPFLDDVYPPPDPIIFNAWLAAQLATATAVYVPVGIKHVDHLMVSNTAIACLLTNSWSTVRFYSEMPYRMRYADLARERLGFIGELLGELKPVPAVSGSRAVKKAALRAYASQTDRALITELMVPEQIWEVS